MRQTFMSAEVPNINSETPAVTDKRGYAEHLQFSVRYIDTLLARGLPHLKVGSRRVRIITAEADAWMKEKYGVQRGM